MYDLIGPKYELIFPKNDCICLNLFFYFLHVIYITGIVLNTPGLFLNMPEFVLIMTGLVLNFKKCFLNTTGFNVNLVGLLKAMKITMTIQGLLCIWCIYRDSVYLRFLDFLLVKVYLVHKYIYKKIGLFY